MSELAEEAEGDLDEDAGFRGQDEGGAPVEEGAPLWIVTFADMMSLLLTFFVLMFSMSEVKQERFLIAAQSLREAMGSTAEVPSLDPVGLMPDEVDPELDMSNPGLNNGATANPVDGEGGEDVVDVFAEAYMDMIIERLQALVTESGLEPGAVEIVKEDEGVYLRIRDAALFPSGSATLLPGGRTLIGSLADITTELAVPAIVSGHADSRPISTAAFPSNWELSAARAAGVARLLVESGQSPEQLEVQSFGEFRPVADNETVDGRAKNRRVELFFSRDAIIDLALQLQNSGLPSGSEDLAAQPSSSSDESSGSLKE